MIFAINVCFIFANHFIVFIESGDFGDVFTVGNRTTKASRVLKEIRL
jgi:hypothetical protein